MELSIVIPAWNEADRLRTTLDRYLPALEARGEPFEVIVVTDGSRDRTGDVARSYASRNVRTFEYPRKLGKGGAIRLGMREARFEYVGYVDADGPIPPGEIHRLAGDLAEVDCVVASRWMVGSQVLEREPWPNRVAGRLWNFLTRSILFIPLRDTQCGAKFFRRNVLVPTLSAVALTNRAFDVDLLFHLRKSGRRVREVPVTWSHDRNSRMPIAGAIPIMFVSLLGVRLINLPISNPRLRRSVHRLGKWFLQQWGTV